MHSIFISYRREDAKAWAFSLKRDLAKLFGDNEVFWDEDTLEPGRWREQIKQGLKPCKAMLVVIGPRWKDIAEARGGAGTLIEKDVHFQEIVQGLEQRQTTVIPVLFEKASMPGRALLPPQVQGLCDQQTRKIGDNSIFYLAGLNRLVKELEQLTGLKARSLVRNVVDWTTPGVAGALTLLFTVFFYLDDNPLTKPGEYLALLLVALLVTWCIRTAWNKLRGKHERAEPQE